MKAGGGEFVCVVRGGGGGDGEQPAFSLSALLAYMSREHRPPSLRRQSSQALLSGTAAHANGVRKRPKRAMFCAVLCRVFSTTFSSKLQKLNTHQHAGRPYQRSVLATVSDNEQEQRDGLHHDCDRRTRPYEVFE